VKVKTTITNPSDTIKILPLQWNQYAWDAMNKDNLRFTKTELVTLKPKETKTVTYEAQPQRESVVYVVAVTQDNEAKSVLDIRYVRDGIEETRINFPGLTQFPLNKDTENTLFACAHSTNQPIVAGNILTLTLKDRDGKTIHEYRYEGDISGAMSGFGEKFKTEKNINYATLTASLQRNGVIVEEVTTTYDCTQIDPSSCLPEEKNVASSFLQYLKAHYLEILLTLVILLLIAAIGVFFYKKRKNHIVATDTPTMTKPM
jgi:LPXTG-motif cell wall-anchored protein